jgi:thioredoxin 1
MKTPFASLFVLLFSLILFTQCNPKAGSQMLPADSFEKEWQSQGSSAVMLDVRTPQEFSVSRIKGAINIDVTQTDFEEKIKQLDKSKKIFVYCRSGSRTNDATAILVKNGFSVVILQQGLMSWINAGFELENTDPGTGEKRLSVPEQLEKLMAGNKLVMVDFYTDWCRPCKMMEPFVNQIKQERENDVIVMKINTDNEQGLAQKYNIQSIPTLVLFKNNEVLYYQPGYHDYDQLNSLVSKFK